MTASSPRIRRRSPAEAFIHRYRASPDAMLKNDTVKLNVCPGSTWSGVGYACARTTGTRTVTVARSQEGAWTWPDASV